MWLWTREVASGQTAPQISHEFVMRG